MNNSAEYGVVVPQHACNRGLNHKSVSKMKKLTLITTILADNNDVAKAFHKQICTDTKKVKAEGVITEKDGKKTIALTKIVAAE